MSHTKIYKLTKIHFIIIVEKCKKDFKSTIKFLIMLMHALELFKLKICDINNTQCFLCLTKGSRMFHLNCSFSAIYFLQKGYINLYSHLKSISTFSKQYNTVRIQGVLHELC